MPFLQSKSIRYLTFESLSDSGLIHAVFTRQGGISPAPWISLNVGGTVGDERQRVMQNRRSAFRALGRESSSIYDVWQVHGNRVVCTSQPRPIEQEYIQADAILTDNPEISLFMRFADCVPVLLHDPIRQVAGIVHAGWQGTVRQTVIATIQKMESVYHSHPKDIRAVIGPSIGPDHYEVGQEVVSEIRSSLGDEAEAALSVSNGSTRLDLWRANQILLARVGVFQIESARVCTACHLDDWYSHRAENGSTGRFGVLVALPA